MFSIMKLIWEQNINYGLDGRFGSSKKPTGTLFKFYLYYCKDAIEAEASEPYKGSAIRKGQAVPSFLSYFHPFTPELPITASAIPCTACNASVLTAI